MTGISTSLEAARAARVDFSGRGHTLEVGNGVYKLKTFSAIWFFANKHMLPDAYPMLSIHSTIAGL